MTEKQINPTNSTPYTQITPSNSTPSDPSQSNSPILFHSEGANLVEKLNTVKLNISTKLSEGEMCNKDYGAFLCSQLQKQGILPKDIDYNSNDFLERDSDTQESLLDKLVYFKTQFIKLLNLQTVEGFNKSYTTLPSTPLKEETQNDLVDYDNLVQQTMSYILNDLNGTVPKSKYMSSIFEFVKKSTLEDGVSETQGINLGLRISLQLDQFKEHIKFTEELNNVHFFDSSFDYLNGI